MPRKNEPKAGDVLLLLDGRMFKLLDDSSDGGRIFEDYAWVQFLEKSESSHVDMKGLRYENLGQTPEILVQFNIGHSIHSRLNKLNGV